MRMDWNVKEGRLEFEDCAMDYMIFGLGTKPLVYVRGLNITRLRNTSSSLTKRYEPYAKNFRLYFVDRRDPVPEHMTVEEIADDVYRAVKELGIDRAYVVGNSQGGMIAQYLALNHPDLVEKLVLNVTTAETNPVLKANVDHWVDFARQDRLADISDEMMGMMYPPGKEPTEDVYADLVPEELLKHTPAEFATMAEACLTCSTSDRLHEIKCPVMVMGGGVDVIMSGEASVDLANKLGTEAIIYEDLGHGAYETREYQERVVDFLKE